MVNNTTIGISKQMKLSLTRLKKYPRQSYEEVIGELIPFGVLFKGEVLNIIERLQKNSGVESKAEVIRDSLELYSWIEKNTPKSGQVIIDTGIMREALTIPRKK